MYKSPLSCKEAKIMHCCYSHAGADPGGGGGGLGV